MRRPLLLTSLDNPRLKQVIRLRKHRDRREMGLFVAEGRREVARAAEAGLEVVEVYLCPEVARVRYDELVREVPGIGEASLFEITPPLLSKVAYIENPEGVMAVVRSRGWGFEDLPPPAATDLFLVAAGINKPGNLGAMARTAAAGGVTALLADAEVDAMNPNAIRASTGAVFTLPILEAGSEELLGFLKSRKARVVVGTPEAERAYTDTNLTGPLAIVIGAEDQGVPEVWRRAATDLVSIPMAAGVVDSLNASNTAAVLLFEALRQRRAKRV
jgi:TrmH family RNA methyltransferase